MGQPLEVLDATCRVHPRLAACRAEIEQAYERLRACYAAGGKLLVCGNGGSAADSEHIVGELMKGFRSKRPLPDSSRARFRAAHAEIGPLLAERLQGALPAIALTGHPSLSTAFLNDVDPALVFAQQVLGYGRPGDVLLGISTSGNAQNVAAAAVAARALGLGTIALTGESGGRLAPLCDIAIRVPERETSLIQELHLPVYHALCAMLEAQFFNKEGGVT